MRRILYPISLLAAACLFAGCGDDNNSVSVSTSALASLSGQYFIHEQVYTYESGEALAHTAALKLPNTVEHHTGIWAHPANKPNLKAIANRARPASGSLNSPVAAGELAGSITLDGDGNVTAGIVDFNEPTLSGFQTANVTGNYALDSNGAGTLTLVSSGLNVELSLTLTGTVGAKASNAQLVEYDADNFGDVEIGTGELQAQDSSAFSQASLKGNYVFGLQGQTCYGCASAQSGDVSAAGLLALDGAGNVSTGSTGDFATGFATDNNVALSGTYTAPDANGRATASLLASGYVNGSLPASYSIYVIDSSNLFVLDTDASTSTELAGLLYGPAGLQTGSFTNSTLSGTYVAYEVKEDLQNETSSNVDTYADASLALLTASGGTISGTADVNAGGTVASGIAISYPYTVAANGRVTFSGAEPGGAAAPVLWLRNASQGYATEQPDSAQLTEAGLSTFLKQTSTSISGGTYATGTLPAATSLATYVLGVSSGTSTSLSGGEGFDASLAGESSGDASGSFTLDNTGRGTFTAGSNSAQNNGIVVAVSPSEFLLLDETSGDVSPTIQILQQ